MARLVEDVEDQDSEWLDGLDVPDDAFVATLGGTVVAVPSSFPGGMLLRTQIMEAWKPLVWL